MQELPENETPGSQFSLFRGTCSTLEIIKHPRDEFEVGSRNVLDTVCEHSKKKTIEKYFIEVTRTNIKRQSVPRWPYYL